MNEFSSTNLSKRMASFLLFLSCFDSLIYCETLPHPASPSSVSLALPVLYPLYLPIIFLLFFSSFTLSLLITFSPYPSVSLPVRHPISPPGVHCATPADIEQHLTLGMSLLARGSYSDALSHFHAAVDADPNNYMSYYKRATVYMALSRPRPALADLDRIMVLKPDFLKARQQRGGLLLKMGRFDEVRQLYSST